VGQLKLLLSSFFSVQRELCDFELGEKNILYQTLVHNFLKKGKEENLAP
jgi:hypothetical protein